MQHLPVRSHHSHALSLHRCVTSLLLCRRSQTWRWRRDGRCVRWWCSRLWRRPTRRWWRTEKNSTPGQSSSTDTSKWCDLQARSSTCTWAIGDLTTAPYFSTLFFWEMHAFYCLIFFSFGITPTMEKLYHKGVMKTKVDDCQFVCIAQTDYYKILHQVRTSPSPLQSSPPLPASSADRELDSQSSSSVWHYDTLASAWLSEDFKSVNEQVSGIYKIHREVSKSAISMGLLKLIVQSCCTCCYCTLQSNVLFVCGDD